MNYENAEPKVTKYLISDGNLVDESGNVIAHSDSLQDMYIKASPQVKKYLLSDGSVVDENNNLIIKNDYFKKMYEQADPKVAKYLHADGTIDENESGGGSGSGLEFNCPEWLQDESKIPPQGIKIYVSKGVDGNEIKKTYFITNGTDSFETQFDAKMIEWQGYSNGYFQACGNVGDDVYVGYEYIPG